MRYSTIDHIYVKKEDNLILFRLSKDELFTDTYMISMYHMEIEEDILVPIKGTEINYSIIENERIVFNQYLKHIKFFERLGFKLCTIKED